jgi:hypothetical protein
MKLTLRGYPGDRPDAADESNLEYRPEHFGFPVFVKYAADDAEGRPVKVSIGFPFIKSPRINAILLNQRAQLEAAANAEYKPGDTEVVLFAQFGAAT